MMLMMVRMFKGFTTAVWRQVIMYGQYVSLWDVAMALWGLFLFSCLVEKLVSARLRRPMLWPVFGIIPSIVGHGSVYDWSTRALIDSGGTFLYRGMWFGGAHGAVTCNSDNIEYMLKTRFTNFPKGEYYRERFRDLLGDGIFNADAGVWKEQRRLATSEMHSPRFTEHSYLSMQELVHHKLLPLLAKFGRSGETIDLQEILLRFTFDNICAAAFGVEPGCLAIDLPEVPFAQAFELATELTMFRFLAPPFVWKPMRYFGLGFERHLKQALKIVHEFADKTVSERRVEKAKLGDLADRSDLLSRLIEHPTQELSDKFLRDFCISFILAGRDTSSVALTWFFWLVHTHPEVERKINRELNEILHRRSKVANKELNRKELAPDDVVFTIQELRQMAYLQAALSESLRLYPSVPLDIKQAQEDDVLPDGTVIKKGARVFYSLFSMGRLESLWGEDCSKFRPERWMKGGEFVSEKNQFKYAVFNAGPRLCIGKKFAYMQMKMVVASVLLRYSVEVVESHPVVPKITTTLYMKHGLRVSVRPRANLA